MSKNEVALRGQPLPENMKFVEADAGLGTESMTQDDQAIPFLKILQDISPQTKARSDDYIDGAEAGMLYNNASNALYDGQEGVVVVPVAYEASYVEYRPRAQGGGFAGKWPIDTPLINQCETGEKGVPVLPSGNELVRTANHYVLRLSEDGLYEQLVLSMASSQLKKSKKWNTMMKSTVLRRADGTPFVPPTFLFKYRLQSSLENSASGQYYNWRITQDSMLDDERIYMAAREFAKSVQLGAAKAATPEPEVKAQEETIPF